MSRFYVFQCDGCDKRKEESTNRVPEGWNDVCITVTGLQNAFAVENDIDDARYLMCASCRSKLYLECQVRDWDRADRMGV